MSMTEADFETEGAEFIRISAEEVERERALRDRFAAFWSTASGDQRAAYDAFISGSPLASDATIDEVNDAALHACFVRPQQARPRQAILFLHGGGYVLGSARAYRGFVSQIVSRAQIPALVISTAAGLVVSRVGKGEQTGKQLMTQLTAQPQALSIRVRATPP